MIVGQQRSWQCVSNDHRQLKSAEREEFFYSALVRPRPVALNHGKVELRCRAREKMRFMQMLGDFIENQVIRSCKRRFGDFLLPFPSAIDTRLVKASEVREKKKPESYRSEAKRLNDFPIFFSPSVYGLAMINASLNRIRNEDILHLQRASKTWQPWTSRQAFPITALQRVNSNSNQLRPVSVTRDQSLYGEGS